MALYYITTSSVSKNAKTLGAKSANQYMYITRQGKYSGIDDIRYINEGNLPNCPEIKNLKNYWQAVDSSGRKNGRAYRKITIALQEEFTLEQNIELVNKLLDHFGIRQKQTYCYAIHDKQASYDPKHRNIHAHVMFNERIINPYRNFKHKEEIFARYKGFAKQNLDGGLKIDRYFNRPEFVKEMRSYWEKINNEKFQELGIDKKISSKSLKAQKEQLEKEGKYEEAQKLNYKPGQHIGPPGKSPRVKKELIDNAKKEVNEELQKIDELKEEAKNNILRALKDNDISRYQTDDEEEIKIRQALKDKKIVRDEVEDDYEMDIEKSSRTLTRDQLNELLDENEEINPDKENEPNYFDTPEESQENEIPPIDEYPIPTEELYPEKEPEIDEEDIYIEKNNPSDNNTESEETYNSKTNNAPIEMDENLPPDNLPIDFDTPEEENIPAPPDVWANEKTDYERQIEFDEIIENIKSDYESQKTNSNEIDIISKNSPNTSQEFEYNNEEIPDLPPEPEDLNNEELNLPPEPITDNIDTFLPNEIPTEPEDIISMYTNEEIPDIPPESEYINDEQQEIPPEPEYMNNEELDIPTEPEYINNQQDISQDARNIDEYLPEEISPEPDDMIPMDENYAEEMPDFPEENIPNNPPEFENNEIEDDNYFIEDEEEEPDITNLDEIPNPPFDENNEDINEKEQTRKRKLAGKIDAIEDQNMNLTPEEMKKELQQSVISTETFQKLVNQEFIRLVKQYLKNKNTNYQINIDDKNLTLEEKIKVREKALFEAKKKLFIKNEVVKRIGEIEQLYRSERNKKRYQRTMLILKRYGFNDSIMTDGIVLTVKDTTKTMAQLVDTKEKQIDQLMERIKERTSKIILNKDEINQIAREKITGNKDQKLESEIKKIEEQINEVHKIIQAPIKDIDIFNKACEEEKTLKQNLKEKKEELDAWKIEYEKTLKKEIQSYKNEIEKQNKKNIFANKEDRETIEKLLLEVNLINKRKTELEKNLPPDTILYGEKIPKRVLLTCKINGKPLKRMPFVVMKDIPYTIINKPKNIKYGEKVKVQCVKLGEETDKGKAKIYNAEVIIDKQTIPNTKVVVPKYTAIKIEPTDKKVPLYTLNNPKVIKEYKELSQKNQKSLPPIAHMPTGYQRAGGMLNNIINNSINNNTAKLGKIGPEEKSADRKKLENETNELERLAAQENEALENGSWAQEMRRTYTNTRH